MEDNSWIKIYRKMEEWCWYEDVNTKSLFIHLLIKANTKDKKWRDIEVKRGQLVVGIEEFGKRCGLTRQQTRTSLDKLISTKEVTKVSTAFYTLITVNNYEQYQTPTKVVTNEQPTSNQPVTTTKEYNNIRNKEITTNKEFEEFLKYFNEKAGARNYLPIQSRKNLFLKRKKSFSLEQIKTSVDKMFARDFYKGNNDRNWRATPEYLLGSDEQVDEFLNLDVNKKEEYLRL